MPQLDKLWDFSLFVWKWGNSLSQTQILLCLCHGLPERTYSSNTSQNLWWDLSIVLSLSAIREAFHPHAGHPSLAI